MVSVTGTSARAKKLAVTKLRVKIHNITIEMEEVVNQENYFKAQELKQKIRVWRPRLKLSRRLSHLFCSPLQPLERFFLNFLKADNLVIWGKLSANMTSAIVGSSIPGFPQD